jgi:hypothetical protein
MIPEVGSEWIARDGRRMRVEEVIFPVDPADMPWTKLTVLNARKGMRKRTEMSTASFGSDISPGFLRPAPPPRSP